MSRSPSPHLAGSAAEKGEEDCTGNQAPGLSLSLQSDGPATLPDTAAGLKTESATFQAAQAQALSCKVLPALRKWPEFAQQEVALPEGAAADWGREAAAGHILGALVPGQEDWNLAGCPSESPQRRRGLLWALKASQVWSGQDHLHQSPWRRGRGWVTSSLRPCPRAQS